MRKRVFSFLALALTGCVTQQLPVIANPEDPDIKVVARIDNLKDRPSWLKESVPFRLENGAVLVLGKQTIGAEKNLEQAFRAAELNAKTYVAQAIEQKIQAAFQNGEEGYELDTNQAQFLAMAATDVMRTSAIRVSKRYWERYRITTDSGERISKADAFVLIEMPEAEFKKAILAAVRKREGNNSVSNAFAKRLEKQWETIMDQPLPRQPATETPSLNE